MKTPAHVVIFVTAKDTAEAQTIANGLLEAKLIACANIISTVRSLFWWQGKIDSADEVLLILKTQAAHMDEIIKKVKTLHSYEVPEVIALPIVAGSQDYLKWLDESVK